MKKFVSLAVAMVSMVVLGERCSQAQYFDAYAGMNNMFANNMDFDSQFFSQLNAMQQQSYQQTEQLIQQVMALPQVQNDYQQFVAAGGQASYRDYAIWWAKTAGGTNIQGAIIAQQQQFEGLQQANRTIQEGYRSYNEGYAENQQRMDNLFDRMSSARRGEWGYTNPATGEVMQLPYTATSGYYTTPYGNLYIDNVGNHYLYQGNGWTQLQLNGG